ncbi:MAG: hypothetical protein SNJ74_01965 [Fimbriimonadaceae bacterium]
MAALALSLLAAGASAQSATFRSESRYTDDEGRTTTIVRSLRLESGGRAELTTSYRNEKPILTRNLVRRYGEVVAEVVRQGSVRHLGGWSREGDRLRLDLDRLESGRESFRLRSAFQYRIGGRSLRVERQDTIGYGISELNFERQSGNIDDLVYSPSEAAGEYHWRYRVRWDTGGYLLTRVLRLERGGRAEMVSELSGGGPLETGAERDRLGRLMERFRRESRLRHVGEWRLGEEGVVVNLRSLDSGSGADARMVFELTPSGLRQRTTASAYGSTRMIMGRGSSGVVDGGTWEVPGIARPPTGETPRPGSSSSPETYAGTFQATFEVRGRGTLVRILELDRNGTATLRSEFRGTTEAPFPAELIQIHGSILDMLRTQRSVVQTGRWTVDNRVLTIRFSPLAGQTQGSRMVARATADAGALQVTEHDRGLLGARLFNLTRR